MNGGWHWSAIDTFDNKHLTVEENLVWVNGVAMSQPRKTERSQGRVPLIKPVLEALKDHRERMASEGNCGRDKTVFCSKAGTPIIPRNFNLKFEELRKKAEKKRYHSGTKNYLAAGKRTATGAGNPRGC